MINSVYTYVSSLKDILENNLQDYLDERSSAIVVLGKPNIYLYEKKTFEKYPSIVILAHNIEKEKAEAGSEILRTAVRLYIVITGDEQRLTEQAYNYEAAVRECIYNHRSYNNCYYVWKNSDFALSRDVGSIITKQITMEFEALRQEVY